MDFGEHVQDFNYSYIRLESNPEQLIISESESKVSFNIQLTREDTGYNDDTLDSVSKVLVLDISFSVIGELDFSKCNENKLIFIRSKKGFKNLQIEDARCQVTVKMYNLDGELVKTSVLQDNKPFYHLCFSKIGNVRVKNKYNDTELYVNFFNLDD